MEPTDEMDELRARGIGIARAHIYREPRDDQEKPYNIVVSMSDYFLDEEVTYEVCLVKPNGTDGNTIEGTGEGASCSGKIAGSTLNTCSNEALYPTAIGTTVRVKITYRGVQQAVEISDRNRSAFIDWS